MKLQQKNVITHQLKVTINQSFALQQHLKCLSLSIQELEEFAFEFLESNPAVEKVERLLPTATSSYLDSIPQPKMEVFLEQIPTRLLSAQDQICAQEIFESLCEEGFLPQKEKEWLKQKHYLDFEKVLSLLQTHAGLGFEHRLGYWIHLLEKREAPIATVSVLKTFTPELLQGDLSPILKKLKTSLFEFKKTYLDVLKSLPAAPFKRKPQLSSTRKVDAHILVDEGCFSLDILSPIPSFSLTALLDDSHEVKQFYKPHVEALKLFIEGVNKRKVTLEKVLKKLLVLQKNYLEGECSVPLDIHPSELARELDIHPSTLARTLQNKTLLCVHGVIELKTLVNPPSALPGKKELLISLRDIILKEDKKHPYSDEKLLQILLARGSKISRRTLSKYRHQLKIPEARLRSFL